MNSLKYIWRVENRDQGKLTEGHDQGQLWQQLPQEIEWMPEETQLSVIQTTELDLRVYMEALHLDLTHFASF